MYGNYIEHRMDGNDLESGEFQGDTLAQTFVTTIGQNYTIDLDAGIFGVPDNGATLQLRVQVFGIAQLLDSTFTPAAFRRSMMSSSSCRCSQGGQSFTPSSTTSPI